MPLIILGIIVILCCLAYAIVMYYKSGEADTRPVRERYPEAFAKRVKQAMENSDASKTDEEIDPDAPIEARAEVETDDLRGDFEHIARNLKKNAVDMVKRTLEKYAPDTQDDDEDKTIIFPTDNVEAEKKKRNIHSD